MNNSWNSYHIFIWDYSVFDFFIKDLYLKLTKEQKENTFYIRYWEGGPHIRIRTRTEYDDNIEQILKSALRYTVEQYPNLNNLEMDKDNFYMQSFTDGKTVEANDLPWYENLTIHHISYEAELERYGGIKLMKYSEDLFCISSELFSDIIALGVDFRQKIVIFYSFVECVLASVFFSDIERCNFCKMASNFWKKLSVEPYIQKHDSQKIAYLSQKINFAPMFQNFLNKLRDLHNLIKDYNQDYANSIVFSHVHMSANRLGINMSTELSCYDYFGKIGENE